MARGLKLTKTEQRIIYRATQDSLKETWKRRSDSILYAIVGIFTHHQRRFRLKNVARKDWEYVEQSIEFKKEYAANVKEYLRLKSLKFFKLQETATRLEIILTSKGILRAAKRGLLIDQEPLPPGKALYVCFDIPEDFKEARQALRRFLKSADFIKVQKSIWKTTRDVSRHLREHVKAAGVERWVTILIGEEI